MSSGRYYWNLTWGSAVKFLFSYFDTSKKKLTLARISPRNIYLNLLGGPNLYWRNLKACNIARRTCLTYVWTTIFSWSYCSLKIQILRLFRARSSTTIGCRFTLKRQKQPPEVFYKKRRPATLLTRSRWRLKRLRAEYPP